MLVQGRSDGMKLTEESEYNTPQCDYESTTRYITIPSESIKCIVGVS